MCIDSCVSLLLLMLQDPEVSAITAVEEDFLITVASHGGLGVAILLLSVVLFTYSVFR